MNEIKDGVIKGWVKGRKEGLAKNKESSNYLEIERKTTMMQNKCNRAERTLMRLMIKGKEDNKEK